MSGSTGSTTNSPPGTTVASTDPFDITNFRAMNFKVDYLTNQNYSLWRLKLINILKEFMVWEVATGQERCPERPVDSKDKQAKEAYQTWVRKDIRASSLLLERITYAHVHLILSETTCAVQLRRLEAHFNKDAALAPAYAIQAMFSHVWNDPTQTLDKNLAYIQSQVNDLRKFRGTTSELIHLIHCLALIHWLPDTWSTTINVLMWKDELTFENVLATIKCMHVHHEAGVKTESTLAIRAKGRGKAKGKDGKEKPKCDNCKKTGHSREQCWSKGGGREGQGPSSNRYGNDKADESKSKAKTVNLANDNSNSVSVAAMVVQTGERRTRRQTRHR